MLSSPPSLPPASVVAPSDSHHRCSRRALRLPPLSRHPALPVAALSPPSSTTAAAEIAGASLIWGFHQKKVCRSKKVWR
ncbi:unnamed protein product [Linum tenue]|uniref:Uncharacterized protein n=1 Tax=Linum tenue TaxID=586396 RepID=A0AAV0K9M6_9ROSI|nr:unnamed protein product [Linum tenue]